MAFHASLKLKSGEDNTLEKSKKKEAMKGMFQIET
jgi:hypothetical protein